MKKKNTSSVGQSAAVSSVAGSCSSASLVSASPAPPVAQSLAQWARSLRMAGTFKRALHQRHRSLSQNQVLEFIRQRLPRQWQFAEVVGQWVWVHLSDSLLELERAHLFELGFHYSPRRRAFQHPCGVPSAPGRAPFWKYFPAEAAAWWPEFGPKF